MEEQFSPGQLVISIAGRDRGKYYLVLDKDIHNMVRVTDGIYHKVNKPKKKNKKHLTPMPQIASGFVEKRKAGNKITDLYVRKILEEMLSGDS